MVIKTLTHKEVENLFLDIWYAMAPETYMTLWVEGIEGDLLISDCVQVYPKLYRNILRRMIDVADERGYNLP